MTASTRRYDSALGYSTALPVGVLVSAVGAALALGVVLASVRIQKRRLLRALGEVFNSAPGSPNAE